MTQTEALRLALVEINRLCDTGKITGATIETIQSIKAALEAKDESCCYGGIAHDCHAGKGCKIAERLKTSAKVKDEPVAWYRDEDGIRIYYETKAWDDCIPLYTTPPQRTWHGLTDEQYLEACQMAEGGNYMVAFQRIQQWLKESNT
jgi:hypothetical protein